METVSFISRITPATSAPSGLATAVNLLCPVCRVVVLASRLDLVEYQE